MDFWERHVKHSVQIVLQRTHPATFEALKTKHPFSPIPSFLSLNISPTLHSFLRDKSLLWSTGPRVQRLFFLDALKAAQPHREGPSLTINVGITHDSKCLLVCLPRNSTNHITLPWVMMLATTLFIGSTHAGSIGRKHNEEWIDIC